jgi:hypothetical protein
MQGASWVPQSSVHILTSTACNWDLVWKKGLCRGGEIQNQPEPSIWHL